MSSFNLHLPSSHLTSHIFFLQLRLVSHNSQWQGAGYKHIVQDVHYFRLRNCFTFGCKDRGVSQSFYIYTYCFCTHGLAAAEQPIAHIVSIALNSANFKFAVGFIILFFSIGVPPFVNCILMKSIIISKRMKAMALPLGKPGATKISG